jgi:hypothetical protein
MTDAHFCSNPTTSQHLNRKPKGPGQTFGLYLFRQTPNHVATLYKSHIRPIARQFMPAASEQRIDNHHVPVKIIAKCVHQATADIAGPARYQDCFVLIFHFVC